MPTLPYPLLLPLFLLITLLKLPLLHPLVSDCHNKLMVVVVVCSMLPGGWVCTSHSNNSNSNSNTSIIIIIIINKEAHTVHNGQTVLEWWERITAHCRKEVVGWDGMGEGRGHYDCYIGNYYIISIMVNWLWWCMCPPTVEFLLMDVQ